MLKDEGLYNSYRTSYRTKILFKIFLSWWKSSSNTYKEMQWLQLHTTDSQEDELAINENTKEE